MNLQSLKRRHRASLILLGIFLASIWAAHTIEVKRMTAKIAALPMKTICVGRFLLDVPANSIVTYGRADVTGWDVSTVADENDAAFQLRLQEKEATLRAALNRKGLQSLESIREVRAENKRGRIYVFNRIWLDVVDSSPQRFDEFVSIDALIHINGVSYEFKGEIHKDEDVKILENILSHLLPRKPDEIPVEEGFCFDRGMLNGNLGVKFHEFTVVFVGMEDHPDMAIALSSIAGTNPGKTFLQRDAENSVKLENRWRFHVLREGRRDLNSIPGEEMLEHVREPNGSKLQGFMWESLTSQDDVYLPSLSLELNTGHGRPGEPIDSSLSDAEALALWDKISSSLRRRPFGAPKPEIGTKTSKLIEHVSANKPCPVSGKWKCADSADGTQVEGEAQRHFKEGQVMPQAVLLRPASLLQKLGAKQERYSTEIPTIWTLVEADEQAATAPPDVSSDGDIKPAPNTDITIEET